MLVGDPAPNVITGGAGNDYIEGKAGADQLSGGGGTNTLGYESSSAGVVVGLQPAPGTTTIRTYQGDAQGDHATDFSNLAVPARRQTVG